METNYTEYDDIIYYDDVNNEISDRQVTIFQRVTFLCIILC